ncbi:MAG: TolC family protein [Bacteroidota bacterium]
MTLEACREQAIANNKELKKAGYQQQESISNRKAARTAYLPNVSANANLIYLAQMDNLSLPGGFLPTAESVQAAQNGNFSGTSNVWSPGLSLPSDNLSIIYGSLAITQPIYTGGKLKYTNNQADAMVDITRHNLNLKHTEIIELTDQAFWNVVMIEANIELAEKYIEMLSELEEQMNDMYGVGLQPASEKLKVSVQRNEAELDLVRAKNSLKIAKIYLNQVLGQSLDTEIQIEYPKPLDAQMLNLENGVELALTNRRELKVLEKQLLIAEYEKKVINADYLPQVGVSASYFSSYDNITESVMSNPMIAAQVTIPIFQWGQAKHKRQAADFKIRQEKIELDNTNDLINLEVMQVKVEVEEAYEIILIAEKNIKEAQESLDEVKASFDVGLNTTADLLNAQADWQNANAQLIRATAQFKVLKTKWERVTGGLVQSE